MSPMAHRTDLAVTSASPTGAARTGAESSAAGAGRAHATVGGEGGRPLYLQRLEAVLDQQS